MRDADILTELRAWRDEFARSHGYDLHAMASSLRALDGAVGGPLVRGEPRRPSAVTSEATETPNKAIERTRPPAGR
jgi:hypothetical protein